MAKGLCISCGWTEEVECLAVVEPPAFRYGGDTGVCHGGQNMLNWFSWN